MDSFEEWAKTVEHPCFQEWGETLVELGASWDSFKRKNKDDIVGDLVTGGIPILSARDIVHIASAEVRKGQEPMAVFWDLENMPIPAETTGREITSSLKAILSQQGDLIQFRAYASIGLNHIPQEKRSDLQLSGCHLVDCPYNGRKEKVADKMIIVDAMQFAFQHPLGATLCFITGDADYAYLLATLQRPQWRTIVVSRGTMQSMLHVNCDVKMRWETDILQPIYEMSGRKLQCNSDDGDSAVSNEVSTNPFKPLTADEEWSDDVELLRSVMTRESHKVGSLAPKKSLIGNVLRSTNPARFPNRIAIKTFLMKVIEKGVVIERGEREFKTLCLPCHAGGMRRDVPIPPLSSVCPVPHHELSVKIMERAKLLPFVIFLRKMHCPLGTPPPVKVHVQSTTEWLLYMFLSRSHAINAVQKYTWLQHGMIVDLGQHLSFSTNQQMVNCPICFALVDKRSTIQDDRFNFVCSTDCKQWVHTDRSNKDRGIKLVLETLEFLASYDDLYCPISILTKLVNSRHPKESTSLKFCKLWILDAEKRQAIKICKERTAGNKFNIVTLPQHFDDAKLQFIGAPLDTLEQEQYVYDLLFDEPCGWMDRRDVNVMLAKKFGMTSPILRNQVFFNAKKNSSFFVGKGEHKQVVALTQKEAGAALERKPPGTASEETQSIHEKGNSLVDDGSMSDEFDYEETSSSEASEEDLEALLVGNKKRSVM